MLKFRDKSGDLVLFTTEEAAKILRLKPDTLVRFRGRKEGPKYIKISNRVFYKKEDLDDFVDSSYSILGDKVDDPDCELIEKHKEEEKK